MSTAIAELIERWNSNEGKPYKGSLIDADTWDGSSNPPLSCMCAQGQVLHVVAGWTPERLRNAQQEEADRATAELLGISRAHAVLLRNINDHQDGAPAIVLTNPEQVIGDQAHIVLAFWRHLDRMAAEQWAAAGAAAWAAAGAAAWDAAEAAAWDAAWATAEIMGARIMRERGQPFFFLPAFGFADPEAVLAAEDRA